MIDQAPTVTWVLLAVGIAILTLTLTFTHARPWRSRLPLRLVALALCALTAWMAADLALRQQVATLDEIVQAGRESGIKRLRIDAGSVTSEHGPLRPVLQVRLPAGISLPLHMRAGTYAPLGVHAIAAAIDDKGACRIADTGARCIADQASARLEITYP
jgi:hypothetical protein